MSLFFGELCDKRQNIITEHRLLDIIGSCIYLELARFIAAVFKRNCRNIAFFVNSLPVNSIFVAICNLTGVGVERTLCRIKFRYCQNYLLKEILTNVVEIVFLKSGVTNHTGGDCFYVFDDLRTYSSIRTDCVCSVVHAELLCYAVLPAPRAVASQTG